MPDPSPDSYEAGESGQQQGCCELVAVE